MPPFVALLFGVLIILLLVWAAFWIVDGVGAPQPLGMLVKAIIAVFGLYGIWLLSQGHIKL